MSQTDIVKRLRQDFTTEPIPLHAEAADEIERLLARESIRTEMLDALRQWQCAERNNDQEELANARQSRDMAIAKVTDGGAG